jgi:hypothetical protein
MKTLAALGLFLVLAGSAAGCRDPKPKGPVARAEFGVFFGGQVQEREEIPFQLDRTRQTQGFRIELAEPAPRELLVTWEIEKPAKPARAPGKPKRDRVTELAEARVLPGETRFEQLLEFKPGDPLGSWKIRVDVEGQRVLERGFVIYDAHERAASRNADGGL